MKKHFFRILTATVLSMALIFSMMPAAFAAPDCTLSAESAILIDANTGEVLFEKDADTRRAPASMTKMMTAILACEKLDMDQTVKVSKHVKTIGGSAVGLKVNEKIKVRDLMGAMLVYSANDCAVCLAEAVSGSEEEFGKLMTQRAKELGCTNTTFKNPSGLDADGHMSTARDMAIIARKAISFPEIANVVDKGTYQMHKTNKRDVMTVGSTDRLLFDDYSWITVNGKSRHPYYKYAKGIKTGFTDKAGGCLASYAVKGDQEIISVVMKSTDMKRFSNAIKLLDYGFDNFDAVKVVKKGDIVETAKVKGGKEKKVELYSDAEFITMAEKGTKGNAKVKVELNEIIKAPIKKGDKLGKANIVIGDEVVGTVNLKASESIEQSFFGKISDSFILKAIIVIILLAIAAFIIMVARANRLKKKRAANRKR